jgi:predicted RNA-binding Zn-ribbon protein involved in translation (DUF1610 family)
MCKQGGEAKLLITILPFGAAVLFLSSFPWVPQRAPPTVIVIEHLRRSDMRPRRGRILNNRGCNEPICASIQAQWNPRLANVEIKCRPQRGRIKIFRDHKSRKELHARLLLLSIFGALTCVPKWGEFQMTVFVTSLRAQAGRCSGTHG